MIVVLWLILLAALTSKAKKATYSEWEALGDGGKYEERHEISYLDPESEDNNDDDDTEEMSVLTATELRYPDILPEEEGTVNIVEKEYSPSECKDVVLDYITQNQLLITFPFMKQRVPTTKFVLKTSVRPSSRKKPKKKTTPKWNRTGKKSNSSKTMICSKQLNCSQPSVITEVRRRSQRFHMNTMGQYPFCDHEHHVTCFGSCRKYQLPYKNLPEAGCFPSPPGPDLLQYVSFMRTRSPFYEGFEVRTLFTNVPKHMDQCNLSTKKGPRFCSCFTTTKLPTTTPCEKPCFPPCIKSHVFQ